MTTLYLILIFTNCAIAILAILLWRVWRELQDTQRCIGAMIIQSMVDAKRKGGLDRPKLERLYRSED